MQELKKVSIPDKVVVSFDVCSLFTNIPLEETIEIALDLITENHPSLKIIHSE